MAEDDLELQILLPLPPDTDMHHLALVGALCMLNKNLLNYFSSLYFPLKQILESFVCTNPVILPHALRFPDFYLPQTLKVTYAMNI